MRIEAWGSNAGAGMSRLSAGDLNVGARLRATEPAERTGSEPCVFAQNQTCHSKKVVST